MRVDAIEPIVKRRLAVVGPDATFVEVARIFATGDLGMLVVGDPAGKAIGLITHRDAISHIATSPAPLDARAADFMVEDMVICRDNDDLFETWRLMNDRRLHNLPVLDADRSPRGVLNLDDALRALLEFEQDQELVLVNYISGVGYR